MFWKELKQPRLTEQIDIDANRVSKKPWDRLPAHWTEAQIVDAVFVIITDIMVSKFGDALGVEIEPIYERYAGSAAVDPSRQFRRDVG